MYAPKTINEYKKQNAKQNKSRAAAASNKIRVHKPRQQYVPKNQVAESTCSSSAEGSVGEPSPPNNKNGKNVGHLETDFHQQQKPIATDSFSCSESAEEEFSQDNQRKFRSCVVIGSPQDGSSNFDLEGGDKNSEDDDVSVSGTTADNQSSRIAFNPDLCDATSEDSKTIRSHFNFEGDSMMQQSICGSRRPSFQIGDESMDEIETSSKCGNNSGLN
jgi:hypothetical protein